MPDFEHLGVNEAQKKSGEAGAYRLPLQCSAIAFGESPAPMDAGTAVVYFGTAVFCCGLAVEAVAFAAIFSDRVRQLLSRLWNAHPIELQATGCCAFFVGVGIIALGRYLQG